VEAQYPGLFRWFSFHDLDGSNAARAVPEARGYCPDKYWKPPGTNVDDFACTENAQARTGGGAPVPRLDGPVVGARGGF